jgi:pyruvate dehydrogenase E2 component (dihydrolipoamide acetyltransferase)
VVARIYVKPGDKLGVGQRILALVDTGKAAPAPAEALPAKAFAADDRPEELLEETQAPEAAEETIKRLPGPVASPSIRKLARELGLDLTKVLGSEPGGRVVLADIRAYVARLQRAAERPKAGTGAGARPKLPVESIDFSKWGPVTMKPLTLLRQVIARRMWENWNAIPHVTQFDEADLTTLNDLRKKYAPAYERNGARLTLTPLVLKALVGTLAKHPLFNASLDEAANAIVIKEYFHIGIAVDTEQGLIVPVLRDVDKKSVLELSKEVEQLAQKARDRKVTADELKGGTFTVSNQGGIGGAHFTPIINRPEVAILGLGRGALKPVARDGNVAIRMLVPLGLSYDHRVIDGGMAARFMVDLVVALQDFKEEAVKV